MTPAVGQLIVRGRADIVERVVCSPESGSQNGCSWCAAERRDQDGWHSWHLEALYLSKRFSTGLLTQDVSDARLATDADHERAKRYAERFSNDDAEPGSPQSSAPGTGQLDLFGGGT